MDIVSWNVNGLRSAEKKGFVQWVKRTKYDFYCLQEVRGNKEQFSEQILNIPGYNFYLSSAQKKGYAGVGVYTKHQPEKVSLALGYREFDDDGRFMRLDYKNFSFINLYIPNGGRKKEKFDYKFKAYKELFKYLKKEKVKNLILTGDFNIAHKEIDLAFPDRNKNNTMFTLEERQLLDNLLNLGFLDTFRLFNKEKGNYTWWVNYANARERNLGWRIDYVYTSKSLKKNLKTAYILSDVKGSDHCPAGINISLP